MAVLEQTRDERFPFGIRPDEGRLTRLTDDIFWMRLTADQAPLGGINVWLIREGDGFAVVDTGFPGAATTAQWGQFLDNAIPGPVTRIIATHFHPDHIGQIGTLLARFPGIPLHMSDVEWERTQAFRLGTVRADIDVFLDNLVRCGLARDSVTAMGAAQRRGAGNFQTKLPDAHIPLRAGEVLEVGNTRWRIELGAGHSPAPALLFNDRDGLAIVGDQLLMQITPHVGVDATDPESDPLGQYLDFLDAAGGLDRSLMALPGHGPAFADPGARAGEIARHHLDKLDVLLATLTEPRRVIDTITTLFRRELTGVSLMMGLSEAHAHLNRLVALGAAERTLDDGIYLFSRR